MDVLNRPEGSRVSPVIAASKSGPPLASDALSTHRRHLALELLATRERFMLGFRPILANHNVTEQQWRIVRALAVAGEMAPGGIAQRCVILKPSLTGILARMEELGWLRRSDDADDQRRSVLRLSVLGKKLYRRVSRDVEKRYGEMVGAIGGDEIRAIQDALDRFNRALDRLP